MQCLLQFNIFYCSWDRGTPPRSQPLLSSLSRVAQKFFKTPWLQCWLTSRISSNVHRISLVFCLINQCTLESNKYIYIWTRPKCITKGILSSCSSLQLLKDLLIAGKILLIFTQRLMDLFKLIMYIALPHTTAFLTSPYYEISKNKSCVQVAKLN